MLINYNILYIQHSAGYIELNISQSYADLNQIYVCYNKKKI